MFARFLRWPLIVRLPCYCVVLVEVVADPVSVVVLPVVVVLVVVLPVVVLPDVEPVVVVVLPDVVPLVVVPPVVVPPVSPLSLSSASASASRAVRCASWTAALTAAPTWVPAA
ncbi:MAG: hypothetical protein A3G35_00390 [candidate division NC10 bacterium RIFCSPLOWO2_12_FULL_66_18]|nr:MAG: hypothetical protein A3G35_00390 [candidate division NC10 bacterium RIFCSPLOWO2_12_FULL_66_18]